MDHKESVSESWGSEKRQYRAKEENIFEESIKWQNKISEDKDTSRIEHSRT